jgi:gliding motility-associated-like protein
MFKFLKLFAFLFILTILSPVSLIASHYMGGEITWQCLGNGNYRFIMKLYRECNGITYNNTEDITIHNYPALSTITLNLLPGGNPRDSDDGLLDGKTDLSPNCWNSTQEIQCNPNPNQPNTGAVEEWYFTSDATYPNGVQLIGVPPAAGWIFSHTGCCRNPCNNIPTSTNDNWFLRAIMYPYNSTNEYPCFDNSPQFAEVPSTVICTGYPFKYNHNAFDKELDSLSFTWAPALNGNISTPEVYGGGYNYNSPLPGPAQNPLNVAATMNPYEGEISYTSYTNGAYVTVTKVTAYRCGIKIAEIFREMQIVLLACPGSNTPPFATGPFYNPVTGLMEFVDTVYAGDVVDFDITSIDYGTLPNGNPQTITLEASGQDFGAGFTNPASGCVRPPCATLNPPPVISAMVAVATHFHWQTSCDHLTHPASITGIPGICGTLFNVHNFIIKMSDNYCPAPGIQIATISIVVLPLPVLKPPELKCTEVHPNGDITITWIPPPDPHNTFNSYQVYCSSSPTGPFVKIDSIFAYASTSKTYSGLGGNTAPRYFYMTTRSGCYGKYYSLTTSDTVASMKLNVTVNSLGNVAQLAWNPVHNPLLGSSSQWYHIFREHPAGSWSLIDSTQQLTYNDSITLCSAFINYRIEISDTTGCTSVSSVSGALLQDPFPPDNISLDSVSVDNSIGKAILGWQPSTSPDVIKYYIYYFGLGIWQIHDSVNVPQTSYIDLSSNPLIHSEAYSIAAVDSCKKLSLMSPEHRTIYLSPIVLNACADKVSLNWSSYINFDPPLAGYRIYYKLNGGPLTFLASTASTVNTYDHLGVIPNAQYCYFIQAFDSLGQKTSSSNIQCAYITKPNQPKYVYLRYATVYNNESVKIGFFVDTAAYITKLKVLRSEDGSSYDTIAKLPPNNLLANVSYQDNAALVNEKSYYYKVVIVDSCNLDILTSNTGRTIYLSGNAPDYLSNYISWNDYEDRTPLSYNVFREVEDFEPYNKIQSMVSTTTSFTDDVENYTQSEGRFKYYIQSPLFNIFNADFPFADTVYSNEVIILQPPRLYVPNAFSPNGMNNIFKPIGVFTEKDNYEFIIYDRWGQKVFETKDYNEGWDGKFSGKSAEAGIYTYYIHIINAFNKTFNKRGTVMLVR